MAATYLTAYIGNYFPAIAALTSHSNQTIESSKHMRPSSSIHQHQQSKYAEHSQYHQMTGNFPQHSNMQPPHASVPSSQYDKYTVDPYHQQTHQKVAQPLHATQQNFHLPTPVQHIQNSYHIPPVMLARFEAFEDISKFKCADEYAPEIDQFMREMEITTLPNIANIDAIQTEISWKHRKSLILWLIEVHSEYDLRPETLYLTINFIDRVCAKRVVKKSEYQLLGLTCLWIASKYEENHGRVPSPKTLALLLESSVPVSRFAAMERDILTDLDFVLGHPTPEAFLKSQCKQLNNVKPPVRALARLILELTLIHRRFRPFRPSLLAMASLILADSLHTCRFWTHGEPLLGRIIQNLEECLIQAPRQIIEKHRSGKFLNISLHVKTMLDNKAAFLYQARLNSTPQIAVDSHGGFMTPPKDSSPFRNPWDPEVTLVSSQPYLPNHIPAQHPHHVQLTPVFQSQQQYIHSQQPPPVPGFQLPVPHQYTHHQPYSQQQTLFRHNSFQHHAANFQMAERTYSEVSGRSAMDL